MGRTGRWWAGWGLLAMLAWACGGEAPDTLDVLDTLDAGPRDDPAVRLDYTLPPLQESVPTYELRIPEATMAKFREDPYTPEQPAEWVYDGNVVKVDVRVRGGSSRWYPKKSWRIDFPDGVEFEGRSKLNLVAEMADRTLMAEKLGFDLLRAMGAHAPRTRFVRLVINGRYEGVYLDIERVDKDFTDARDWADRDPSIYRCGSQDCEFKPFGVRYAWQADWEKETNEAEPRDDLRAFLDVVNFTPEPEFARHLDVDDFLRSMVADALISNDIVMDSGSYLIRDKTRDRWTYVPWDYNNAMSRWWPMYGLGARPAVNRAVPVFSLYDSRVQFFYDQRKGTTKGYLPTFSNLTHRVASNRALRARYGQILQEALDRLFTPDVLHPRIEKMHALVKPHVEMDPYVLLDTEGRSDPDGLKKFHEGRQWMLDYVSGRATFLKRALPALRAPVPRTLVLSALNPAAGWVELRNDGATVASTEGMVLTTDLRRAVGVPSNVPAMELAPGQTVRLMAAELGLSLQSRGTVGLFDGRSVVGVKDVLFYGPLSAGYYSRSAAEPDDWAVVTGT